MDTTSEVIHRILDDLCAGDSCCLTAPYSRYYDSLNESQSREVVTTALKRIMCENDNATCEFGEDGFTLRTE